MLCGTCKKDIYCFFNLHELVFMVPETASNEITEW